MPMAISSALLAGLTRAAFILTGQIRKNLRRGKYPDEIEKGIVVGHPKVRGGSGSVKIVFTAPQSKAFEEGSGIHGEEGKPYIIEPDKAEALAFEWGKTPPGPGPKYIGQVSDGKLLFRFVEHPGIEAIPYIVPAILETSKQMKKAIGSAFRVEISHGQKKRTVL